MAVWENRNPIFVFSGTQSCLKGEGLSIREHLCSSDHNLLFSPLRWLVFHPLSGSVLSDFERAPQANEAELCMANVKKEAGSDGIFFFSSAGITTKNVKTCFSAALLWHTRITGASKPHKQASVVDEMRDFCSLKAADTNSAHAE